MVEENNNNFLGELGLILLAIVLAVIFIPVLFAISIAWICGASGLIFYGIIITISFIIWSILGLVYYI